MAATWNQALLSLLTKQHGDKQGHQLNTQFEHAFPLGYSAETTPDIAASDINRLLTLSDTHPLDVDFYLQPNTDYPLHVRLFQWQKPIPLADVLPMLENLDLRANSERPYKITLGEPDQKQYVWISDFAVTYYQSNLDFEKVRNLFEDAFSSIYMGECENDGFNKLILSASLSWHDVIILRTYAKYLRQVGFRFTQPYIEKTLASHADITNNLVKLFKAMLDPNNKNQKNIPSIEQAILNELEAVSSLDEDRILRRFLHLIKATLRTNFFQKNSDNTNKNYLSIKLSSRDIPELPLPVPLYEIFVYSPHFEGIHLRNTKVARGGIRWSDRREDFRTEILGLMKAQVVKNAVIVPSGAKGGFVLKHLPHAASRDIIQAEVIKCYIHFISGLLDITDNIKDKKTIQPPNVVCLDEPDPYLVVAADKGTATFSDTANSISRAYHFWLDDAFASGGKTGYDHKKMGITARGAWESIKRHFHEFNVDATTANITVAGIGDMSGDVFGNGMIYSRYIRLVFAFDHRHIFIDPDPHPESSYKERVRLFNLPTSSWEDYNTKFISPGGGVYKRSLKSITLTPEAKRLLQITNDALSPNDLIKAILKAPVDLLFNGGIGTYVKSTSQSHADVGDRTNDFCRVNGNELRCKVVGEGGNLGFTQLGRIEYALTGGLINTDFIDNSAGVDCSDHEVNLKILVDTQVQKGKLTEEKRNELLASLTQEVASLVLHDNYHQALVMSFSSFHASKNISLHQSYIKELEQLGILNRQVEFLPDDKTIAERKSTGLGLTRPELAILLAYSKIHIKSDILKSSLITDPYLLDLIDTAFPPSIREKYSADMKNHRLHENILATQLSNKIVNEMGFTFIYRIVAETGSSVEEIIRAYILSSKIFGIEQLQNQIESLQFKLPLSEQYEMLFNTRTLINLSTRWFIRSRYINEPLQKTISHFAKQVATLENVIPTLMGGYTKDYLHTLMTKFAKAELPENIAKRIGTYRAMYTTLNIVDVANQFKFDLEKTAQVYFLAGERINLVWFRDQIATDSRSGHWNILARLSLRDELDACQRAFTVAVMQHDKKNASATNLIECWSSDNQRALTRWSHMLEMLQSSTNVEYTMFFIAIRELQGLITTPL